MVIEDRDLTDEMLLKVGNVICGTNKSRDFFNHRIRELRGISSPFPVYGDRVICRNNNWGITNDNIALANGLTGFITSPIDPSRIYNGKDSRLYGTFRMDFLPDLLQYPFRDLNVNYEYLVSDYAERNKIKNNRYTNGELFEYANAITTHLSQGSEYPAGIFYEEFLRPQIQNQLNYTGITRFKKYLIYVKKTKRYY
jgi:ATP-dependent exoDNAse (exonuclease V) alpha subunit